MGDGEGEGEGGKGEGRRGKGEGRRGKGWVVSTIRVPDHYVIRVPDHYNFVSTRLYPGIE